MTTLKPYPAYYDPGVDWLGNVPQHWQVLRLRSVAHLTASNVDKISTEGETQVRLCNYTDVYKHHLITNNLPFMAATASKDEIQRLSLRAGDVMITKDSETFDDIGIPAVADEGLDNVVLGYHLMLARPKQCLHGPYLAWFFTPKSNRWQFEVSAKGVTRFGMPQSGFKDALVSLPPLDEQRAIAAFLDAMDARITRFIAARKKMIRLLEEKKQAVINQAVTKGLDPTVPMRDSGVDWLGEIPAHWEVRRLKDYLREVDERSTTGEEELLSVSHLTGVTPRSEKNITMFKAESYIGHKLCRPGDIVANTMWLWMGAIGMARNLGIVSPSYAVYRPNNTGEVLPSFLALLLRSRTYVEEYHRQSTGIRSSRLRLYPEQFLRLRIATPPLTEQQAILDQVFRESYRIDSVANQHHRQIELVQEYHTRLISDVVTGKLDVRRVDLGELPEFQKIPDDSEPIGPVDGDVAEFNDDE